MALTTIEWAHYTFNPWWGCTKVSTGCRNCYAQAMARRFGTIWGPGRPRRCFGDKHWNAPLLWNRLALKENQRPRVFCGSMCDIMDEHAPAGQLKRLLELISKTPHLDWMLLTKRPERLELLPKYHMANAWVGTSVETEAHWGRVDTMIQASTAYGFGHVKPRRFAKYFVSIEPMLGPVPYSCNALSWTIVGGESGCRARRFDIEWAEQQITLSRTAGVPVFVKQIGNRPFYGGERHTRYAGSKGGSIAGWPKSIQVREKPR